MIGGRTEKEYLDHFNRATQANRQPGSVFKPFIYLSAIENGATPCTQLLNQPLVFFIDDTTRWNPQNHDGSTGLLTSLRDGIKKSLNLISVRVVQELISPNDVKNTAERLGITTPIRAVDAIALGVSEVYPLNITMSYSAIANNGILHIPNPIVSVEDNDGRSIKDFIPYSKEVADEREIFILRDMMKSVVDNGTGGSLRWKYKFYSPAAGKTGTTNSKTDAWFIGFTPSITMGIWVGVDDPQMKLGDKQYGSNAAMPIFAKTINKIYDMGDFYLSGKQIEISKKEDWDIPDGIVEKNICKETCCLNTDWCESYKEYFIESNAPTEECEEFSNPLFRFKQ
jgi:penicillin-binding protein 1A